MTKAQEHVIAHWRPSLWVCWPSVWQWLLASLVVHALGHVSLLYRLSLGPWALAHVLQLLLWGWCVLDICERIIAQQTTHYTITDRHLHLQWGWLSRHSASMNWQRLDSIDIHQHLLQRMLGYGNLHVHSMGGQRDILIWLSQPANCAQLLRQIAQGHHP